MSPVRCWRGSAFLGDAGRGEGLDLGFVPDLDLGLDFDLDLDLVSFLSFLSFFEEWATSR